MKQKKHIGCGLRLSECTQLKPGHIDGKRRVLRVIKGKGGKSREVPVSEELLVKLRRYWKAHRNPEWLFPGVGQGWTPKRCSLAEAMGRAKNHLSNSSAQNALKAIVESLGWEATRALGGKRYRCKHCQQDHYAYHSCNHRSWPERHAKPACSCAAWCAAKSANPLPNSPSSPNRVVPTVGRC